VTKKWRVENGWLQCTAFFSPFAFNCFYIPLNYASAHRQSLQLLEAERLSGRSRRKQVFIICERPLRAGNLNELNDPNRFNFITYVDFLSIC